MAAGTHIMEYVLLVFLKPSLVIESSGRWRLFSNLTERNISVNNSDTCTSTYYAFFNKF